MKAKLIGMGGIALLGFAASAFVSLPAMANGGDFFNELSESWGANSDTGVPYFGWVRDAKGKAIPRAIVTATPGTTRDLVSETEPPKPLLEQLGLRGRLVIPVGDEQTQSLVRVTRTRSGFKQEPLGECKFVKLFGKYGWRD